MGNYISSTIRSGLLARSKAGHDFNQLYVIIKVEGEYVYLVDGKNRPLNKAKKKNIKHIQPIYRIPCELRIAEEQLKNLRDEEIKRIIKLYEAGINEGS